MAARQNSESAQEILFENSRVSLCLVRNSFARAFRIVDFRSGSDPTKRGYVMSMAQREGVERVYTVVERDEVSSWTRMGFHREGSIAAFYKRSDAFILGAEVPADAASVPLRSKGHAAKGETDAFADATYQRARRLLREQLTGNLPAVRVQRASPDFVKKTVAAAVRSGRALTRFEPFGRDVERRDFVCTARGGFSLVLSVETQVCFDNAFVELLTVPRTDREMALTCSALTTLCDALEKENIVSSFAVSPASDPALAAAFLGAGFRRTGLLAKHLRIGESRCDAFLWSRRLALPDPD